MNATEWGNVWKSQLDVETNRIVLLFYHPYMYVHDVAFFHLVVSSFHINFLFITLALHLKYAIRLCSKFEVVFNNFSPMFL